MLLLEARLGVCPYTRPLVLLLEAPLAVLAHKVAEGVQAEGVEAAVEDVVDDQDTCALYM